MEVRRWVKVNLVARLAVIWLRLPVIRRRLLITLGVPLILRIADHVSANATCCGVLTITAPVMANVCNKVR